MKLAQREEALTRNIPLIEWTFDPLELKNAHFNIERLGAIVRRRAGATEHDEQSDQVIIAHHDTVIEADDHVIVFVVNKRMVPRVEKLFQVEARFF